MPAPACLDILCVLIFRRGDALYFLKHLTEVKSALKAQHIRDLIHLVIPLGQQLFALAYLADIYVFVEPRIVVFSEQLAQIVGADAKYGGYFVEGQMFPDMTVNILFTLMTI